MAIRIEVHDGYPTIGGKVCTFQTKEIRTEIEDMAEVNDSFLLPKKYVIRFVHSTFWGTVAKIKLPD